MGRKNRRRYSSMIKARETTHVAEAGVGEQIKGTLTGLVPGSHPVLPGAITIGGPHTISTSSSSSSTATPVGVTKKTQKMVDLPGQISRKMLVAFLDSDDGTLWAKKLYADNVEIFFDDDGEGMMTLRLKLLDVFDNDE